mmetsp:Transcript_1554/g.3528  ORF Transcript_1554/g.3528 Transcript_1554/m.3528 type:complete len:94 (+) Transcript_1554:114-395(+)
MLTRVTITACPMLRRRTLSSMVVRCLLKKPLRSKVALPLQLLWPSVVAAMQPSPRLREMATPIEEAGLGWGGTEACWKTTLGSSLRIMLGGRI